MNWLTDIPLFALLFFILVFIHELGHFLMARLMKVRVEKFSIGMGPALLTRKYGDTEYRLALVPLGGYVKMSGDDPTKELTEEERRVGFLAKKPPQKLLIVFGGPVFNLILPIFVLGILLATGIPTIESVIGTLDPEMPAAKAGLQSGDRILTVNGNKVWKWSEVESAVEKSGTRPIELTYERIDPVSGEKKVSNVSVEPKLMKTRNRFGQEVDAAKMGISPDYVVPVIFFETGDALIAKVGMLKGDRIRAIDKVPTLTQHNLDEVLAKLKAGAHTFQLERGPNKNKVEISLNLPEGKKSAADRLGLIPSGLVIGKVEPKSPAEKAGLQKDDHLLKINSVALTDWTDFAKTIRSSEGKPVEISISRKGQIQTLTMTPEKTVIPDPVMGRDNPVARDAAYRVGVATASSVETSLAFEKSSNPIEWVKRGFSETWKMTTTTVEALVKLVTGQLSLKLIGSPVMIYKVAGNSYRLAGGGYLGWYSFFNMLALLSVTLGIFNLFPIPVLDGGHAVFYTIEWIRGRPVSVRAMELAMQFGLVVLIMLFVWALYNDFNRYGFLENVFKIFGRS